MKSVDEIKEYLNTHWFKTRRHAYYIRGFLLTEFPEEKGFVLKYAFAAKCNRVSVPEADVITATDAINFIEDEV